LLQEVGKKTAIASGKYFPMVQLCTCVEIEARPKGPQVRELLEGYAQS